MKNILNRLHLGILVLVMCLGFIACGGDDAAENENKSPKKEQESDSTVTDSSLAEVDTLANDTIVEEVEPPKEIAGQEDKAQSANVAKKSYDLSEHGFPIIIDLPAGTKMEYDEDFEELTLKFGADFVMVVGENFEGSISKIKSKFKNTMHNQHLGYIKDEPNGIVKKSKANGIETHSLFYTLKNDELIIKSVPSKTYSKAEIMEMWTACETIKLKE